MHLHTEGKRPSVLFSFRRDFPAVPCGTMAAGKIRMAIMSTPFMLRYYREENFRREEAAVVPEEKQLTEKQKRFVREWLVDFNGTRAAIRAGYSEKSAAQTASRLMKDSVVQEYRNRLLKEQFDALGVTQHSLAAEAYEMMQRCKGGSPHMVWNSATHEYEPDGTWECDTRGFFKAQELLLKMLEKIGESEKNDGGSYEDMIASGGREF